MRKYSMLCIMLTLTLVLASCSAPGATAPAPMAPAAEAAYDVQESKVDSSAATGAGSTAPAQSSVDFEKQKIIRTANIELETKEFDNTVAGITKNAGDCGGYIENSEQRGRKPQEWNESGRTAVLTIRVPVANMDAFLSVAKNQGELISESISSENVSEHYYDITARKEAYKAQLETLKELVAKAQELDEVLKLETEISRLQYEIETIDSTLRRLDSQVSYSTVQIGIRELTDMSVPQAKPATFGDRLNQSFESGIKSAINLLQNFTLTMVAILPTLLIIAIVGMILFLLIRIIIKPIQKHLDSAREKRELQRKHMVEEEQKRKADYYQKHNAELEQKRAQNQETQKAKDEETKK